MKIVTRLNDFPKTKRPIVLTIGNFDGVHLGHLAVLQKVEEQKRHINGISVVLTFSNHPSAVLRSKPVLFLCSLSHKLKLIEKTGIDTTILLPFTKEFSEQSHEEFLYQLRSKVPFSCLVLGYDAAFGKDRIGNKANITYLANKDNFRIEETPPLSLSGKIFSSSAIRTLVQEGKLSEASQWLGRPFSIIGRVMKGQGKGKKLGYPTANINVDGLCLPPLGVYKVSLIVSNIHYPAVANLGHSPTLKGTPTPVLEAHIINKDINLYDQEVEIQFERFIRKEQAFASLDDLKKQIASDIQFL